MNRTAYNPTIAKPSAETATVGIQKNKALKMGRPRLAEKNTANDKTPKIQNLGDRILATNSPTNAAIPVAFDPLRSGQKNANSAMNIAATPLRMPFA